MASPTNVHDVDSLAAFEQHLQSGAKVVTHFWATWCEPCKHMDTVVAELARLHGDVAFLRVEAEEVPDVSERYGVSAVPCFLAFKAGALAERLEGADAAALTAAVQKLGGAPKPAATAAVAVAAPVPAAAAAPVAGDACSVNKRCEQLVNSSHVMLFMKGQPDAPQCGFSRKVVDALRAAGSADFGSYDILRDEAVRQGLKAYSNWPTFPQLYVGGELVGGCDIILEMAESGELKEVLQPAAGGGADALSVRLKALINSRPVMLFMKGTPDAPQCGFSRKVVDALRAAGVADFGSFDILRDEAVRQGLKQLSDWPTFPQLYAGGELVGGCDIVLELAEGGELASTLDEMCSRMDQVPP